MGGGAKGRAVGISGTSIRGVADGEKRKGGEGRKTDCWRAGAEGAGGGVGVVQGSLSDKHSASPALGHCLLVLPMSDI